MQVKKQNLKKHFDWNDWSKHLRDCQLGTSPWFSLISVSP